MKWVRGSANCPEWLGIYEKEHQRLIQTVIKPAMIIYDIGSHAGFFTLAFSKLSGSTGHVYAFEPLGANVAKLLRHLSLNRISNVTVLQVAVSDKCGIYGFDIGTNDFVGHLAQTQNSNYLVPAVKIDSLVNEGIIAEPDFVKIDVENSEYAVLNGSIKTVSKSQPAFIISCHSVEQETKCRNFLVQHGYTIHEFYRNKYGSTVEFFATSTAVNPP